MRDLLVLALLLALASQLPAQTLLGVGSDMPAAPQLTSPPAAPIDAATSRAALDAFLAVYYDEVTGDARFRDDAAMLHAAILKSNDSTYGGGIHWKSDGTRFKNVPTNAPFVIASLKLARATGDARYRQVGLEVHDWMVRTLWHDGALDDGIDDKGLQRSAYTYNYGTFIGACLAVHEATGDPQQLAHATKAADWAIANLAPGDIVKDEGSGDGAGFKMILTRYLAELAQRPDGGKYAAFLHGNARAAWEHRRRRDSVMGYDWSKRAPDGSLESFTAAAGVELLFHSQKAARPQ